MQSTSSKTKMPANKTKTNLILAALFFLLWSGTLIYYFKHELSAAQDDYNKKISELGQKTSSGLNNLQQNFTIKIAAVNANLSSEIGFIDVNLKNFKAKSQQDVEALSSLIDEIEKQSSINLNELKDELKNIRIKSADFSAIINDVLQSVVSVSTNLGQGSGAIIDSEGYVVTNFHVINGASAIKINTYSGKSYNVEAVAGFDENADIAVLKINAPGLKALGFGDSSKLQVGERVIAAGNPAGLSFTVTEGIVSAFRTAQNQINYIQTDVPINPGNSGGPLINTHGEIVGINDFKYNNFESLGFAISSNDVKSISDKIIADYKAKIQKQNQ